MVLGFLVVCGCAVALMKKKDEGRMAKGYDCNSNCKCFIFKKLMTQITPLLEREYKPCSLKWLNTKGCKSYSLNKFWCLG